MRQPLCKIIQTSPLHSAPTTAVATTSTLNNTVYHDSDSEINKLTSAFGLPFYELTDAKDTGKEVLNIDPQQTKDSYCSGQYERDR